MQSSNTPPAKAVVADIGGTNARFAVADLASLELAEMRHFLCSDHPTLAHATRAYLDALPEPPAYAAIAVAAPVAGDEIRLTNSPWSFARAELCRDSGLAGVLVLNDFQALALSLPHLQASELAQIGGGEAAPHAPKVVVGPGTGIGVGLMVGGRLVFGCNHTELGHVRVVRAPGDTWPGICAFHFDCVEGLASGPAIAARAGMPAKDIPSDSPVWDLAAHALAQLLHTVVLATAPQRILIGGGVPEARPGLVIKVRRRLRESLNGYLELEELNGGIDRYVIEPGLGPLAGPLGALALAADAYAASAPASVAVPR